MGNIANRADCVTAVTLLESLTHPHNLDKEPSKLKLNLTQPVNLIYSTKRKPSQDGKRHEKKSKLGNKLAATHKPH